MMSVPALIMMAGISPLAAQSTTTGDLTGVITDPNGAAVTNAQVTLTNQSTGESFKGTTNGSGQYRFAFLRPGNYTLTVNAQGFQTVTQKTNVNLGQATTLNVQAGLAGSTETVEVSAEAPLLQQDNANLSTTFNAAQIDNLPAPGGDTTSYAYTAPGVTISTGGGYGGFSAYGLPSNANLFTVNGNDNMDPYLNLNNSGASNLTLGANELSEVAVVENGYSVQYGRQAGAQVNTTTKSGGNAFHGNASYWYNAAGFNANDWFNNHDGTPRAHAVNNQYAASIGGPIIKNKLFFFADQEGLRYVLPGGGQVYTPTADFAKYVAGNVAGTQPGAAAYYNKAFGLYAGAPGASRAVPLTAGDDPALGCGSFSGTQQAMAAGFGATYKPDGTVNQSLAPCAQTYRSNVNNLNTEWLLSTRVDWNINANNTLFGRYRTDHGVQATGTDPINSAFNANSVQPEHEGQLNWTHILGATATNQFIASGMWYSAKFGPTNFANAIATFPTTFSFADGVFNNLGGSDNAYPQGRNVTQWQLIDDFSKTTGNHDLKFGVNFRRNDITSFATLPNTSGLLTFNSMTDFVNGTLANGSQFSQNFNRINQVPISLYSLSVYAQDQWRPFSSLSVTYGLRIDRNGNPGCASNCFTQFNGNFAQTAAGATLATPYNSTIQTGLPNAFPNIEAVVVQPRVGLAWTVRPTTVVRTGIGLFSDLFPGTLADRFVTNAPNVTNFVANSGTVAPGTGSAAALVAASNAAFQTGFANGASAAALAATVPGFALPNFNTVANRLANPKFLEYNLEIEQTLSKRFTLSLNYVGNYGYDELNQNPYLNAYSKGSSAFGGVVGTTPADPRFGQVRGLDNHGYSNYNGFNPSLKFRVSNYLQGSFSYTWSHALDTCSNECLLPFNALTAASIRSQISPTGLSSLNYGNADYDTRHAISANYVLTAPKNVLNSGLLSSIFGGWNMAETIYFHSGYPFSVVNTTARSSNLGNTSGLLTASLLGDYLGGGVTGCTSGPAVSQVSSSCISTAQFVYSGKTAGLQPNFGNLARNSFRGPGYFDTDLNLTKNFRLTERYTLGVGANAFNILNHPNFDLPVNNLASGSFGQILNTVSSPTSPYGAFTGSAVSGRVLQLNAHFIF
jgi:Carboxypeptidase regulatory-like domain/TonB-dependent Receptor Plug Domain